MKKTLTLFFALNAALFCFSQDSSFIDLGRTQIRKDFAQTVTIKGEDLERIPAVSLEEAINVWLYGTLSHLRTLTYVVDGQMIADVNIYSIHDIEEVQLIQNAASQLNGAFLQQQLVLVKTKRKRSPGSDFRINGQSAFISNKMIDQRTRDSQKGENSFFHHYFLSARHQSEKTNAGVSLSYLKDVNVLIDTFLTKQSPDNLERIRFNSYFDWRISRHHTLLTKLNLAKQTNDRSMEWYYVFTVPPPATNGTESNGKDQYFDAEATLQSRWPSGFSNKLTAAYAGFGIEQNTTYTSNYPSNPPVRKLNDEINTKNFLINNSLRWLKETPVFTISPAINFYYRYISESLEQSQRVPAPAYENTHDAHVNKFLVTPSVDLKFKNAVNLQVGMVSDLSQNHYDRFYPYTSLSASVSELMKQANHFNWKIFASYSQFDFFYDHAYALRGYDETITGMLQLISDYPWIRTVPPNMDHYNWQLGTSFGFWNNRLNLAYNFEKRTYAGFFYSNWGPYYALTQSETNDIRVGLTAFETSHMNWLSAIHLTSIKNDAPVSDNTGSFDDDKKSWSFGWNNRFQRGRFIFGIDILWQLNKREYNYWYGTPGHWDYRDLFALHNAYAGYKLNTKKAKDVELYLTARNPVQDNDYTSTQETRSYFGAGFKAVL